VITEKKLRYSSIDGTRLAGVLLMPSSAPRAVILLHGINVDKDEWGGFHKHLAEELFRKRIASLRFDFRGHGESGGDSMAVLVVGDILDVRASVREMRRRSEAPISFIATSFAAGPAIFAAAELGNVSHLILIAPVLDYVGTFLEAQTEWARGAFNERSIKRRSAAPERVPPDRPLSLPPGRAPQPGRVSRIAQLLLLWVSRRWRCY
jgi:pimeloyl-ACP methyl ester carboxylesterase